jgi:hypothetical protein
VTSPPAVFDEFTLLCERCGYVVEGLPAEGACPECGKPIVESLPERRRSIAGQGWLRIALSDIRHPIRSLDTMRIEPKNVGHGKALRIWASASIGLWPVPVAIAIIMGSGSNADPGKVLLPGLGLGCILFIIAWLSFESLTWIESRGLQFISRHRGTRITRAISSSICGRGSLGWLFGAVLSHVPIWLAAVIWVSSSGTIDNGEYRSPTLPGWAWTPVELSPLLAFAATVVGFLFFETFAWLGLRRLKYANRVRPGMPTSEGSS